MHSGGLVVFFGQFSRGACFPTFCLRPVFSGRKQKVNMSNRRLTMRMIREVLRLKFECGLSHVAIGNSCGISKTTVGTYLARAANFGVSWPLGSDLDDVKLEGLLFPADVETLDRGSQEPDWSLVHQEL